MKERAAESRWFVLTYEFYYASSTEQLSGVPCGPQNPERKQFSSFVGTMKTGHASGKMILHIVSDP